MLQPYKASGSSALSTFKQRFATSYPSPVAINTTVYSSAGRGGQRGRPKGVVRSTELNSEPGEDRHLCMTIASGCPKEYK